MFTTRLCVTRKILSHFRYVLRLSSTGSTETASGDSTVNSAASESDPRNARESISQHEAPVETNSGNADEISNNNDSLDSLSQSSSSAPPKSNYVRAFEKLDKIGSGEYQEEESESQSFASLLRKSKLMQIGNPDGRVVLGTIVDVVGDDLYIDFGGKFHCVCTRPSHRGSEYTYGTRVKLKMKDFEMTSAFLGSDKHVTLLEADASIIGIHRSSQWAKTEIK